MNDILIVYATREGQTAKVAARIAAHLAAAGARVDTVNARDRTMTRPLDLTRYDLLVFGASLHAGGIERELVDFVNHNTAQIEAKRRSFFLVLLSAATRDPELRRQWLADAREKLSRQLRTRFEHIEMIAGALTYSKYPLPLRWVMRRISKQAGGDTDTSRDYEYTDWRQVERYAAQLLES